MSGQFLVNSWTIGLCAVAALCDNGASTSICQLDFRSQPFNQTCDQPMQPQEYAKLTARFQTARIELITHLLVLGTTILLLWVLETVDQLFWQGALDFYGIEPRTTHGLRNIFLAPFLHQGFDHLIANTLPFLVLGWFVLVRGLRKFILVSVITATVSGLGIWLLGRPATIHIGLSGVIFGYLGFLLFRGYFERSSEAIGLAILVGFLYGSMIWDVLPQQPNISWLSHLFGFFGGALAARYLTR